MDTRLIEYLVKVNLTLLAPAYEVVETAALEPELVLLLFHYCFESK